MVIRLSLTPLLSGDQARARDRHTIDALGVPGFVLMEHAGRAVADVVVAQLERRGARSAPAAVLVVCGAGNNGGDGHVCARHLLARGVDVVVLSSVPLATLKGDAATAADLFERAARHLGHPGVLVGELRGRIAAATPVVIVDALFGTGLSRPLDEQAIATVVAIETVRRRGAVVVAVDVPSGLSADGLRPPGPCVEADVTVTFGGLKIGHVSEPGGAVCGEVVDVDLGFIPPPEERLDVYRLSGVSLPPVDVTAHKGRFGHVGVIAGDRGMGGAAVLSALAALRAGAGLVTLVGDVDVARPVEVMAVDVAAFDDGRLSRLDGLVIGPGLDGARGTELRDRLRRLRAAADAAEHAIWTVADAGALGVLERGDADVWTPHPGEAARVLGVSVADIQRDRLGAARALVDRLGGCVVLKGHAPVVATATRSLIVPGDAPALAMAGSGDVLAGLIAAGLAGALGPSILDGVVSAAVWLHQQAGRSETRGLLAGELAGRVRDVIDGARRRASP